MGIFISRFLPPMAQQALEAAVKQIGIPCSLPQNSLEDSIPLCTMNEKYVQIGKTKATRYSPSEETKVPDVTFYDIPQVRSDTLSLFKEYVEFLFLMYT